MVCHEFSRPKLRNQRRALRRINVPCPSLLPCFRRLQLRLVFAVQAAHFEKCRGPQCRLITIPSYVKCDVRGVR